jgi:hypothetical protein
MYTIELDNVDPVTLGFSPNEIKVKNDGTYVVERKQFRVSVWDPYNDNIGGDAWCPCSHEIFDGANWSYGGHYYVDGGSECKYGKSRVIDQLILKKPSRRYGVEFTPEEEADIQKACSFVSQHKSNVAGFYQDYIKKGTKARLGSAPKDPYHDPFLPDRFKKMLGDAYVGAENV